MKEFIDQHIKGDRIIWMVVGMLCLFSILVVYSATGSLAYRQMDGNTEYYLFKHTLHVLLALSAMWVAHKINYKYYAGLSRLGLYISVPLLLYSFFYGTSVHEASRWITIPVINQTFQPSDFAKLALITNLASMLSKRQGNIDDFKRAFLPVLFWCGLICALIGLTNLSSALLLFLTCVLLMFIGRVPFRFIGLLCLTGLLAGVISLAAGQRMGTAISRVNNFLKEEKVPYQARQSYIAIATGGVIGKGPGNSYQRNLLPHPYSDFIYSILIEEYGFIGGVTVLLMFLVLLYRGMRTVSLSERPFGGLLSAGLSFTLVMQAMVNMGVAVGLGPITGMPLPLVSMGGTSLLFTGVSLGIILSVSRGDITEDKNEEYKNVENARTA